MTYPVGYPMDGGTYPSKEVRINWRQKMEAKDNEIREALDDARYAGYLLGKQVGIREVVEWIENKARHDSSGNTLQELAVDKQLIIDVPLWQIKLNEWGIKR